MCAFLFIGILLLAGCDGLMESEEAPAVQDIAVPQGFAPVPIPDYNPLTIAKVALGKRLFFDPLLSRDQTVSCGSCHLPEQAFAHNQTVSPGVDGRRGIRNAPSLLNVAYQRLLLWDGGSPTLEAQVLAPLADKNEMDLALDEVVSRLNTHPLYPNLFEEAFGQAPDVQAITRAIAAFERTLVSTGSRYDRFAQGDASALTAQEQRGAALFFGKAGCNGCHGGFLFSNALGPAQQAYVNNGLQMAPSDSGRARITFRTEDFGKFKIPSLRNVALTAPYMHDGRFATLAEVVSHYDAGGAEVRNQDTRIRPLDLSTGEQSDLVAFLHALSEEALTGP